MGLGVTQPSGCIQPLNFKEQYEQCSHEDHDITLLDFIFEHILNLETIVNLFEGENEYTNGDSPHVPFQQLEASQNYFTTISFPHLLINRSPLFEESSIVYNTRQNDKLPTSFCTGIFRPPILHN